MVILSTYDDCKHMRDKTESNKLASLGNRIRAIRESRDISQEQLADSAGLDRSYVSRLERGLANPSFLAICKVAGALNVHPKELVSDTHMTG